jgi:hypothetical protein
MLAARARWWQIAAGIAVLLPFQSWGIAFDFLAQVGFRLGPDISSRAGLSGWRVEVVALGYQVGSLLLPTLMPVILWGCFCPAYLGLLRRGFARARVAPSV